ncbi:hypothetical protein QBC35DRAFT_163481 [Podospora australis]|uniref:Ams2/SPT21 N-terminal domain-containing protein n=1 Tax=Podospora australis TaxID=1536484 RepID=A0AAN6X2W0_9PEZI|nr:hypothetical protein QBC35DRAFT_163481 [Podospora australis]
MALDERTTIGVIDLRTCLQAVAQCSPEIINHHETDYSVYAYDYSEPELPLVGQGLLSWALDQNHEVSQHQQQQLVTGRVTRNLLAILSNGSREMLEVRLKLTAIAKMMMPRADFSGMEGLNLTKSASIPADTTSEWNSFIQSNPMFGHATNVASMPSPALPPAQVHHFNNMPTSDNRPMDMRCDSVPPQQPARPDSIPPPNALPPTPVPASAPTPTPVQAPTPPPGHMVPQAVPVLPPRTHTPAENAPSPVAPQPVVEAAPAPQSQASRPSSRASRTRKRVPTGRPRGRPRKQTTEGNTSAAEEVTDGDEGPQKKRAKVTRTEYPALAPFGSAPDSLRVAASTSGSLRTFRPVGSGSGASAPSHLSDVPRAPTPVPDGELLQQQQRRRVLDHKARSESIGMENIPVFQPRHSHPMSQDARSPAESMGQSPDQGYTPEDSPGDLGSSPPVPRASAYMQSSPPASSPVLPPLPDREVDSGFMSGGLDDFFDDDEVMQDLPQSQLQELPVPMHEQLVPERPVSSTSKPVAKKNSRATKKKQATNFPFQEVNPGPPELLPVKSIFNPAGRLKSLNRPTPPAPGPPPAQQQFVPPRPAGRSLKRSHTAPNPVISDIEAPVPEQPQTQHHQTESPPDHPDAGQEAEPNQFSNAELMQALRDEVESELPVAPKEPARVSVEVAPPVVAVALIPERPQPSERFIPTSHPASRPTSRPASRGPQAGSVPPSESNVEPALTLPRSYTSEAACPSSDYDPSKYNKNMVKKQSIKERLETAILKGESPPFCNNCGAIETPTWRKIWTQDHQGVPGFHEFSDKPGFVTMIDVLERDSEGQPSMYRLVKKSLGARDDKKEWTETLLCNPCGIWLAKFKTHRPPDRWDKDAARLNQPRKKRGSNGRKKARAKSDGHMNPTSDAYFTTDPLGPMDHESPDENTNGTLSRRQSTATADDKLLNLQSSPKQRLPGSTHSRGSGTADSPIAVEDDLGSTRRLLFPSPRKETAPKVLGELAVNVQQTFPTDQGDKSAMSGKENCNQPGRPRTPVYHDHDELVQELFGTPPARPSTPPPKSATSGIFKTPTRPTPSHRPITRSISKSIQSIRSIPKSPGQLFSHSQRTPSRTPHAGSSGALQSSRRRSPRNGHLHAHFALDEDMHAAVQFDSPFTATLTQLLSEANDFTSGSPAHGLVDIEIAGLPQLDSDGLQQHLAESNALDFANFLSTDMVIPSSPPLRNRGSGMDFGGALGDNIWPN